MTLAVLATTPFAGPERSVVEEHALIHLARLHRHNGGYLRSLGYYNGELDSQQGVEDLYKHLRNSGTPGILIATGAGVYRPKSTSARHYKVDLNLEILFASAHVRSFPSRLRGDVAAGEDVDIDEYPDRDPGIYRMMRDVRDMLLGFDHGLDGLGTMRILREDVVFQDPAVTLWRVVYAVAYHFRQRTRSARLPNEATEVEIRYNVNDDGFDADDNNENLVNPVIIQERTP